MKTLYVSDLDGTLITHKERISDYSCNLLNEMFGRGLLFTCATARSLASAEETLQGVRCNLPVIAYNGALLIDPVTRETVCSLTFGGNEKEQILSILNIYGVSPIAHARENEEDKILWIRGRESEGQSRYLSRRAGSRRLDPVSFEQELCLGDIYFYACSGSREIMQAVHDTLERAGFYSLIHPEPYRNECYWLEILPHGATKANGVLRLKELLGCERAVCFGDSANDSEMFDVCDECYAVANADEWLKAKATGVIGYSEEDGVVKWLAAHAEF